MKTTKQPGDAEELLEEEKRQREKEEDQRAAAPTAPRATNTAAAANAEKTRAERQQKNDPAKSDDTQAAGTAVAETLTPSQIAAAIEFNRALGYSDEAWALIAEAVGSASSQLGESLVTAIASYQTARGLAADGKVTAVTRSSLCEATAGLRALLSGETAPDPVATQAPAADAASSN